MLEICVDERDFARPAELMDYLQRKLDFPAWFGGNLRALNDCLGDISEPTRLYVMRDATLPPGNDYAEQMDRLCMVLLRSARENPYLSVSFNTVRWPE